MTTEPEKLPAMRSNEARRSLRWFVIGVIILVLFNVLLFAKFVMTSGGSKPAEPASHK